MPKYSQRSLQRLKECDVDLQRVFFEVIKHFDCTILKGYRGRDEQDALFLADPPRTKVRFPNSKHNHVPSLAVDVAPYPVDWDDRERFTYLAGHVMMAAKILGVPLRWGGDWDKDTELDDNRFDDLPHFELTQGGKP